MEPRKFCRKNMKVLIISYACTAIAIIFDQVTKSLAAAFLRGRDAFAIIPGVFELRYLENDSAAFSLDPVSLIKRAFDITYFDTHPAAFLAAKMTFLTVLTLVVVFLLVLLYNHVQWERRFLPLNLIILGLIAGAIGNMIDRLARRYVIDFFYFRLINFPIFNVADIYVTVSAVALIIYVIFFYREEDFARIFPPRDKNKKIDGEDGGEDS
ncbi:MAG: signal peptidase II [Clostridiales bacterium]|nr:signal peptidase II [Clostridiales bacterium]